MAIDESSDWSFVGPCLRGPLKEAEGRNSSSSSSSQDR